MRAIRQAPVAPIPAANGEKTSKKPYALTTVGMDCYSAVSVLRARLKKAQEKPSFGDHYQYFSEPAGMRVLAFAPKRRAVENGNGRLPGGTLVLLAGATP